MWRVLTFLILIAIAAYGAVWLANSPETLSATWGGTRYTVSLAVGVTGIVAAALLVAFVLALINGAIQLPVSLARRGRERRERRGRTALSRGIIAIGAGDIAAARRHASEAERLLGHEPLALLLKAQAAQANGDRERAEAAFREMAQAKETKVLGLRGLYIEAHRRGDATAAREYAEEAARAAPAAGWATDAVLEGLSAEGNWAEAVRMIERRTSLGLLDRATSRRQRAVLLTAAAQEREATDPDGALATGEQAVKLAPELVPAAVLVARLASGRGDLKKAARVIEAAWSVEPHPELAGAYLNLRPGDSALDRLRRAETLAKLSSWSDESRLAIARGAIEARDFTRARDVLQPALQAGTRSTVRLCMAMAEIEGRSGNAGAAREWLARAARAPRDKAWIADGYVSDRWLPVSPVTGRLDAFTWQTPPELLGNDTPDLAVFEPDTEEEEEVPAFLGRAISPPAEVSADPDLVPTAHETGLEPPPASPPLGEMPALQPEKMESAPAASIGSPPPPSRSETVTTLPRKGSDPAPVVFPVRHAPDDPGPDGETDRRERFRLHV